MTVDNYQTIYELGFRSFQWLTIVRLLAFIVLGLLIIKLFKKKTFFAIVGVFVASISTLILFVALLSLIPQFVKLRSAYMSGKSMVAVGVVQSFHPAPIIGSELESFSVNGVSFSYYAGDDAPCFHNAPLHKGPIRDGLNVRIHYYEDCIQRVEVLHKTGE